MIEPPLLTLQAAEHLPLPALPDCLDGSWREVHRRLVIETRAQEDMDVVMRHTVLPAVLMHREGALDAAGSP
jgi:hypothetical protein